MIKKANKMLRHFPSLMKMLRMCVQESKATGMAHVTEPARMESSLGSKHTISALWSSRARQSYRIMLYPLPILCIIACSYLADVRLREHIHFPSKHALFQTDYGAPRIILTRNRCCFAQYNQGDSAFGVLH